MICDAYLEAIRLLYRCLYQIPVGMQVKRAGILLTIFFLFQEVEEKLCIHAALESLNARTRIPFVKLVATRSAWFSADPNETAMDLMQALYSLREYFVSLV